MVGTQEGTQEEMFEDYPVVVMRFETPLTGGVTIKSEWPKPCRCGQAILQAVEAPGERHNGKARTMIYCPTCKSTGLSTIHGPAHAVRRWNVFGPREPSVAVDAGTDARPEDDKKEIEKGKGGRR